MKTFLRKKEDFASFPLKLVNIHRIARMGQNFDDFSGFQQIPGMPILTFATECNLLAALDLAW